MIFVYEIEQKHTMGLAHDQVPLLRLRKVNKLQAMKSKESDEVKRCKVDLERSHFELFQIQTIDNQKSKKMA